jgi:hypothetical protein
MSADDHSGLPPISSHPVEGHAWEPGTTPWLRGLQDATPLEPAVGYTDCLFCGASTMKLSVSDVYADAGRLTVYCDNTNCSAREVEIVVVRDGAQAARRADVRALRVLDRGGAEHDPTPPAGRLRFVDLAAKREVDEGDRLDRRIASAPMRMQF